MRLRKILLGILGSLIGILVLAQLVPYGRDHTNPKVVAEPAWNQASTRELAVRACFDCHSNQTKWPWYTHVAPVSWFVQHDVDEGRDALNFSDWSRSYAEAGDAAGSVLDNEMPPAIYRAMHPEARLSANEKRALADGLRATLGTAPAED